MPDGKKITGKEKFQDFKYEAKGKIKQFFKSKKKKKEDAERPPDMALMKMKHGGKIRNMFKEQYD
tara:strand:+ start:761 stop:955 length:195 start_codon:yes stop_codon:yes gene_type:complete